MMINLGKVESLWRYPVKSMRGEAVSEAFMSFSGFYGDRRFAIVDSAARKGFPFLTGTTHAEMLTYRPQFRHPARAARPPNLIEAMSIAPGVSPINGDDNDLAVDVVTPSGALVAVDDPALLEMLSKGIERNHELRLIKSDRPLIDCRPISLISTQTVQQLQSELGTSLDKRCFRANIYVDLERDEGFAEDALVGRRLRIGSQAMISVLERDPRCKMISLDPDSGEHNPEVLRKVAQSHQANAGLYCAVLVEGLVSNGDPVELLE
jgi:uncharacterized protein YcbX